MTENTNLTMLKQFIHPIKYTSKFHEAIIAYLSVNFITVDEENELRRLFRYMDKEGKNAITKEEMKKCLEEINLSISDQELQKVFESVDDNGSGYIEYQEFIRNACNIKNLLSESNLKNVFQAICGDKEKMSGLDIKNFIFHDSIVYEHTLNEYFEQIGMRYQESITFEQFYLMIKKNKKLGQIKKRDKSKRESKYTFDGPIIDEADDEEDLDEENEDEKENKVNKENKDNKDKNNENNKDGNKEENKEAENKENENEKKNDDNNNQ